MHTLVQRVGDRGGLGRRGLLNIILCGEWPGVGKTILLVRGLVRKASGSGFHLGTLAWPTRYDGLGVPVVGG